MEEMSSKIARFESESKNREEKQIEQKTEERKQIIHEKVIIKA